MMTTIRRVAVMATALASAPAAAELPQIFQPGPAFALESAGGGGYSGFHFGAGTATAGYVNPQSGPFNFATATVSLAPNASITLTAINAASGSVGSNAHGELRYDYLATIVNPASTFTVGDAYFNVVTVTGSSNIATTGLNTSLTLTTSARGGISQISQSFDQVYGDGAGGGVTYSHSSAFTIGGAGQFQGYETVGTDNVAVFTGTIALYTNIYGTTTTTTTYDYYGYPHQTTTIDHPGATGSLFLDPLIVVNPTFIAAAQGSGGGVTLSPGVANAGAPSGAPEPAAWALLIAGFGLTGAVQRRRRVVAA